MQKRTKVVSPETLMKEYREILKDESIEALPFQISGNSMAPFLIHQRDTVYLSRLKRTVKKGDIVLYQRDNGAYVLHRVVKTEKDHVAMIGDGQFVIETGIRFDQIIAIVTSVQRKGKTLKPGDFWWDFFEKCWIHMIPFRKGIWHLVTTIKKLLNGKE